MFMMNPMMYSSMMYSPMMYSAMYAPMMSANTPSYFQQKYGCGAEDFAYNPFLRANPVALMRSYQQKTTSQEEPDTGVVGAFKSYFA